MAKTDFKAVAQAALQQARSLVEAWLPNGRYTGAEYQPINPKRSDSDIGSFCINVESGVWKDFASGEGGGDLISLYAYVHDVTQGAAAKALGESLGVAEAAHLPAAPANKGGRPPSKAIFPVPLNAPPIPVHAKLGKPSKVWSYQDAQGQLLWYVCRFDPPEGRKQFAPLTWQADEKGTAKWTFRGPPPGRVVYKLPELVRQADAPVCICEGEKAADAAAGLLPDFVTIASMGGANAWKQTHWQDLTGRAVAIWPDNDEPGQKFAESLNKHLLNLGVKSLQFVRIPSGKPEGWDAADAVADGWTAEQVRGWIKDGTFFQAPEVVKTKADAPFMIAGAPEFNAMAPPWPVLPGWTCDASGVRDHESRYVCMRPAWLDSMSQNQYQEWGIRVSFFDHNWNQRFVNFPSSILSEQGGVLGRHLQLAGMGVIPGREKYLARYFAQQQAVVKARINATARLGWWENKHGDTAFLMPDKVIGKTSVPVVFQPEGYSRSVENLREDGTLEEWQTHVRDLCAGNPFLMFGLLASLAGPLLRFARCENGGFHFYGLTTGGKTTAAQVAASVWGCAADPQFGGETIVSSWDATANGLEILAEGMNDLCMILDEIGKAEPADVARSIYKVTGGLAKSRATLGGQLRPQRSWRLLIISTGEVSIRQVFALAGAEMKAGQRLRFPDIPVDDDKGNRSIIRDLHGADDPKDFAELLKGNCELYHGTAGPALVEYLVNDIRSVGVYKFQRRLAEEMVYLEAALNSSVGADGKSYRLNLSAENRRVVRRFAVVAMAAFYATTAGIIDWDIKDVIEAIREVRDCWLNEQGEQRCELDRGIDHLAAGIARNTARFVPIDASPNAAMRDVLGYRAKDQFMRPHFVLGEPALRELCGSHDAKTILRELRKRKLLTHDPGKLTRRCPVVPALGDARPYLYWISSEIFGEVVPEDKPLPDPAGELF